MALGVSGFGCEDALTHLMNYVWPNIFETSPHVVNAVQESIEGMRVALGPGRVLQYCLQVSSLGIKTYNSIDDHQLRTELTPFWKESFGKKKL